MTAPTPEAMTEYRRRLAELRAARARDEDTSALESQLTAFMVANGFGEEIPVTASGEPE